MNKREKIILEEEKWRESISTIAQRREFGGANKFLIANFFSIAHFDLPQKTKKY